MFCRLQSVRATPALCSGLRVQELSVQFSPALFLPIESSVLCHTELRNRLLGKGICRRLWEIIMVLKAVVQIAGWTKDWHFLKEPFSYREPDVTFSQCIFCDDNNRNFQEREWYFQFCKTEYWGKLEISSWDIRIRWKYLLLPLKKKHKHFW